LGIIKIFATSFTIGSGGSGGIFAPSLYIGSMFGAVTGLIAQYFFPNVVYQPYAFALIGMGALFAGACRAPVTALIMIPEMTNNHYLLIPMIIVSTLSYFVASSLTKSSMYLMKLENRGVKIKQKENVLEDVLVEDVMAKRLDSITPDTKVSKILSLMLEKRHPGFPVVDSSKRFYGFVKIYDLKGIKKPEREKMEVKEIANRDYPHVSPTDNVYHALNVMINHNLGRIPVIIKKNKEIYIVGVISKTDVIKAYEQLMK
jgi:CIC family chloride channel protein